MIKLDSNENQNPHYMNINEIISFVDPRMYPDITISTLREKISKKYNVAFEEIFCSNGSDNLIKVITFCLVSYKEEILIPELAFPTYEIAAKMKECEYKLIPLKNYCIDLDNTINNISDKTKLIWLSNPHNPTGTVFAEKEIDDFMEKVPSHIYVVLDEAYVEYLTENIPNSIRLYNKYKNLIILRTFSKAYGLAGARIGYGFARKEIYSKLALGLGPFDVNSYAQTLACAAIETDDFVNLTKEVNKKEMKRFENMCEKLNIEYIKSYTSFIMIKLNDETDRIYNMLKENNVYVKNGSHIRMPGWLRISCGTKEQNSKVIELIEKNI